MSDSYDDQSLIKALDNAIRSSAVTPGAILGTGGSGGVFSTTSTNIVGCGGGGGGSTGPTWPVGGSVSATSYPSTNCAFPSMHQPGCMCAWNVTMGTSFPLTYPPMPIPSDGVVGGDPTDMEWVKKDMKLNKKALTVGEVEKLAKECTKTIGKNETLIVCVDPDTPMEQMNELKKVLAAKGVDTIIAAGPITIDKASNQKPSTLDERVDILARIGVLWDEHPNLRLGQLIAMALDTGDLCELGDEPLAVLMECAYKASRKKK